MGPTSGGSALPPGEADLLDPERDQFGDACAGFQQDLQYQPTPSTLGVGLVQENSTPL
ncbi:MAG: hypothetical protein JO212_07330 [Acetobacteraceae bacterium]|nr:hypothetical protein [Acetobacteraceae bacterium]